MVATFADHVGSVCAPAVFGTVETMTSDRMMAVVTVVDSFDITLEWLMNRVCNLSILLRAITICLGLMLSNVATQAQTKAITGTVRDSAEGSAIPGASIRAVGLKLGTYSQSGGRFKLPMPDSVRFVLVRSVGYEEKVVAVPKGSGEVIINLLPDVRESRMVNVVADIPVDVIIRRAIERKNENAKRIKSIVSTLYTKVRSRLDAGALGDSKEPKESIAETFSVVYDQREPEPLKHVVIQNRRQTKNVSASGNMMVIDQFFDFTQDELKLFQTRLVTPLSKDALSEYKFELVGKRTLDKQLVYEITFEPKARMYPGLIGKLSIIEDTYQVIAAEFQPTEETAIPFVRQLRYEQRYEKVSDSIWAPTYQQATARAGVKILSGVMEIDALFMAQTYVTDVKINIPIADSLLRPQIDSNAPVETRPRTRGASVSFRRGGQVVTVAPDADSAKPEYWEQHSFTEQTEDEKNAYAEADSLKRQNPNEASGQRNIVGLLSIGDVGFSAFPILDRTSYSGMMYGGALVTNYDVYSLVAEGAFGGGSTRVGALTLSGRFVNTRSSEVDISAAAFSEYSTIQGDRNIFSSLRSLNIDHLLFAENFDFVRRDGFSLDVKARYQRFTAELHSEWTRQMRAPIIAAPPDRVSVLPDVGNFQVLTTTIGAGEPTFVQELFGTGWPVYGSVKGTIGVEKNSNSSFNIVNVLLSSRLPTFATGYAPMKLELMLQAGLASDNTPRQYQFNSMHRIPLLGARTDFNTLPINRFGGTEILSAIAEHNFTDLWWRAIGIPLINNRGVDLIGRVGALQVIQRGTAVVPYNVYASTQQWYTEAGFAVSRIPTFVSEVIFLRFDAMWPVGGYASQIGRFGWNLSLSSPFN